MFNNKTKDQTIINDFNRSIEEQFTYFTKYTRRHELARFIAQYELFKKVASLKGSIVECGVYLGGGVMAWAKISEILEPYNFLRKIYGFDTFDGFPSIADKDLTGTDAVAKVGLLKPDFDVMSELTQCVQDLQKTRLLPHQDKVILIKGDAMKTIPDFLKNNKHALVSLLYLDFDLYEPTLLAINEFLPRMSKGSIIVFDEINDPKSPGETVALLEALDLNKYKLEFFPFEPHISWITIE